jgi:hypothetical protein
MNPRRLLGIIYNEEARHRLDRAKAASIAPAEILTLPARERFNGAA